MLKRKKIMIEHQQLEGLLGESVSRETLDKLFSYREILLKWNDSINLVAPGSLGAVWERHFLDSAQLYGLIPKNVKSICDIGSGAGFPGLVLALLRDQMDQISLVESDQRKCLFLKNVSRETLTSVQVCNERIEKFVLGNPAPEVVTARALASLDKLFGYVFPWAEESPGLVMLFMKGKGAQQEIAQAKEKYHFDVCAVQSKTSDEGAILKVTNLRLL